MSSDMPAHYIIEGVALAVVCLIGRVVLKDLFGDEEDTYHEDGGQGFGKP